MKIENQVCSLDMSKQLKELGVKQESYFWWVNGHGKMELFDKCTDNESISAFTVSELGKMLPRRLCDKDNLLGEKGRCYLLVEEFLNDDYTDESVITGFSLRYGNTKVIVRSESKLNGAGGYYIGTEADVRASMIIYLIKNNLLQV